MSNTHDPLRFIPFHRRYQTHNGNGVPMGISDLNSFADVLSGTRGILTQEDPTKRPALHLQSAIPFLRFDGTSFLAETFTLAQPVAVILAYRNQGLGSAGTHDIVIECGPDSENEANLVEDNRPAAYITAGPGGITGGEGDSLRPGVFNIATAIYNNAQSSLRLNGQTIAQGTTATRGLNGLTLGSALAGRSAAIDVIACLIPVHLADVSLCEKYLETLLT